MDDHEEILDIVIRPDGTTSFVYDDRIAEAFADVTATTRRASFVEPARVYGIESNGWVADLSPVNGPILSGPDYRGFDTRQDALDAERQWLREERGL